MKITPSKPVELPHSFYNFEDPFFVHEQEECRDIPSENAIKRINHSNSMVREHEMFAELLLQVILHPNFTERK